MVKTKSKKYSEIEKELAKILEEIARPSKPPLRVIGYLISDGGETRIEIGFKP